MPERRLGPELPASDEPLEPKGRPPWCERLVPLRYAAHVYGDGVVYRVEFPDAPGCRATAIGRDAALEKAALALDAWLRAALGTGDVFLRPGPHREVHGCECASVYPAPRIALAVMLKMLRQEHAWSQAELAERAGLAAEEIASLEDPEREVPAAVMAIATEVACAAAPGPAGR